MQRFKVAGEPAPAGSNVLSAITPVNCGAKCIVEFQDHVTKTEVFTAWDLAALAEGGTDRIGNDLSNGLPIALEGPLARLAA
jgi:hypothetical protein